MNKLKECEFREQMNERMSLALDGLLSVDEDRRLQQHLKVCPQCQADWKAMEQISATLEQSPMVGPPLGFAIRVERRLNENARKRRRVFGGLAVLTSSLSLAGVTVTAVALVVLGAWLWRSYGSIVGLQEGTWAVSRIASGMGLMGKGASLFLVDFLLRYGSPLVFAIAVGLVILAGIWVWVFLKRPGGSRRNGYV